MELVSDHIVDESGELMILWELPQFGELTARSGPLGGPTQSIETKAPAVGGVVCMFCEHFYGVRR